MSNAEVQIQNAMLQKYEKVFGRLPKGWMCLCMLQNGHIGLNSSPKTADDFSHYLEIIKSERVGSGWSDSCTKIRVG